LNNFNQEFDSLIVSDIRKSQIEDYQQKRLKARKAPATVDREVGDVKTMVNAAYDDGLVGAQVVMTFKRVKNVLKRNANARKITLSLDNFLRLLSYAPPHLAGILGTGFYTGMRKSEILGLTWDKVDLANRLIYLEAEDTKDDEPRVIPICDELYEILRIQPKSDNHNHLFSYRGKRIKDNFKRSFQTACRRAGIPYGRKTKGGITFHDLRHTFNTHMRKAGVPESVIMQITGHSTREMFDRYNTVDEDDAREAVEMFSGYLNRKDVANVTQTVTQEAKKASLH
jgi:integrase